MYSRLFKIFGLALLYVLILTNAALAMPPLPFSLYGTVKVNGANVPVGTVVSAWCGGVQYRSDTTIMYNGESWYGNLDVPGDDPDTPEKDGCNLYEIVSFKVAGDWADQTAQWMTGMSRLDLTAPAPPVVVTYGVAAGWNLLALNVLTDTPTDAESILTEIAAQGGNVTEVDRWLNGGWDAHILGLPFNNFTLELGQGYFFKATAASSWQRTGRQLSDPLQVELYAGWNLIGLPRLSGPLTAEGLLVGIEAQGGACSEVDRWLNGGWDAHIKGLPFNDFELTSDQGYFVKCTQHSFYTP